MEQPLVSVITITRNRGKLLGRCISSVLGQTYKNIEHIVVDGASDDETDEVIASISDSRLKFIKLESNWSIVDTINWGFKHSTGSYITFLDSDDEYLPCKVEEQVKLIQNLPNDYGMVYCWMSYYDSKTYNHLYDHISTLRGYVLESAVSKPLISGTPTFMFRRNVFQELGGWKDIGIVNDWELGARCCKSWKVDFVPKSLVKVYINHGSRRMSDTSANFITYKRYIQFHMYFLDEYRDVFIKHPKLAERHNYSLALMMMSTGDWKGGFEHYFALLKYTPKLKYLVLPIYCLLKPIRK